MNKKIFSVLLIAILFFSFVSFFKTCSIKRHLNKQDIQYNKLQNSLDSLIKLENERIVPATTKQVRDEMQRIMLDFLIYENDLDKNKISISAIKDKIEADDEE